MSDLMKILNMIIKLLKDEKQALIDNDGELIAEIVVRKNEYIEKLSAFKGLDVEKNPKVMELIEEINSLQELNLLLTNQGLSFQNALVESISKNIHKLSNTYSPKGNYKSESNISLIDQSV